MNIEVFRAVILLSRFPKSETRRGQVPNAGSIDNENWNRLYGIALAEHADSTLKGKACPCFGQWKHNAKEIMPAAGISKLDRSHLAFRPKPEVETERPRGVTGPESFCKHNNKCIRTT